MVILVVATIHHPQICLKAHGLLYLRDIYWPDWDGSTAVAAGEFAFSSDLVSSQNYVVHQQGETYEIGQWDDSSNVDVSHADKVFGSSFTYDIDDVVGDLTSGTKLGIRFYDNTNREDGGNVVRYNTSQEQ